MGGKKSKDQSTKPAKPTKGSQKIAPPTTTQIAIVGSKGHGKKAFCEWIGKNYDVPVNTTRPFEVVCTFTLTVDGAPEVIKITISPGEDPTDRAKMARYGQTDILLLVMSINVDPKPEVNHFAEYWEFYTQLCINKKDTSVIVVGTKGDLRDTAPDTCLPKDGFQALIDKHKFVMRDNATDHERSKFIAFECSNTTGAGIEAILMESVRQKRALAKSQATPQPTKK